jgi:DnaJ-class molecular chaperone
MSAPTATDVEEIRALARIIDELDYYTLLGVDRKAQSHAVRQAYHAASRRFHPNLHRQFGEEVRMAAERVSKRVAEAYSVLRDPRRRMLYDERLDNGGDANVRMPLVEANAEAGRRAAEDRGGRTPNGKRYFALAQADLARGDVVAATRNLFTALTFEPENAFFKERLAELKATKPK